MGIDPIRFQQFNPNVNAFQGSLNPAISGGNNPSIFGASKGGENNTESFDLKSIIAANMNVTTPKTDENNLVGVSNPFVDGNNGLTSTQRVNPATNSNPLKDAYRSTSSAIENTDGELHPNTQTGVTGKLLYEMA
jgi:hypothetical protein